jgi:1-acyl-sn-glycerol-3-phosphate acyltransferase
MPRAREPDPAGVPELPAGLIGAASPDAGVAYRVIRGVARLVGRRVLRFRVEVEGWEHLPRAADGRPRGGWIAASMPHRTWIDPFVVWAVLPVEPRLVFIGDARTMARSPLRRWVVRRVGGILPIPSRGGVRTFATHVTGAIQVLDAGAVFCLFPESGPPAPASEARPIAPGLGYIALRSGAPIIPIVLGGTHELYLGRRILVRILPPVRAMHLAWPDDDVTRAATPPPPGSRGEREAAHRVVEALHARTAPAVRRAFEDQEPPSGTAKRWRGLTTLFR